MNERSGQLSAVSHQQAPQPFIILREGLKADSSILIAFWGDGRG